MAFVNNDMTQAGNLILARAQTGEEIEFSRMEVGSGYMPDGVEARDMTAVVNPVITFPITKLKLDKVNRTAIIGGVFNNADQTEGFYYRELAIYAIDPDAGEVMYCYGNAGDLAEWIPAVADGIKEKSIDVIAQVGSATNIKATVESGIYATVDNLLEEKQDREAADNELQEAKEDIANKGIAGGYAELDENALIPLSRLPDAIVGSMTHAGDVDISTAIANLTSNGQAILGITDTQVTLTNDTTDVTGYLSNQGNYFIVTVSGTFANIDFNASDWLIANSNGWGKLDNTSLVNGVKGNAETNYRIGNINITLENLGYSAQATEPTASSTDSQFPTAKRLWSMMGGALSTLKTTAKTITGAINELWGNTYSLSGGIALGSNANLNTLMTPGDYFCNNNSDPVTMTGYPSTASISAFTLKVEFGTGTGYPIQTLRLYNRTNKVYTRFYSDDAKVWSNWVSNTQSTDMTNYYTLSERIVIPSGANLNTYITPGGYICRSDADAATISNTFTQQTFLLTVEKTDRYVIQTQKIIYNSKLISRYYNIGAGTWSNWLYVIQNTDLAYKNILPSISNTDTSKVQVAAAYTENGQVHIYLYAQKGAAGDVKTINIASAYRPRVYIAGSHSYASATDVGKVYGTGISADGYISIWLSSALNYNTPVTFVYPLKTS